MAKYTPLEEYLKGRSEARRFRFALPILKKLLGSHCRLRHENIELGGVIIQAIIR